MYRQQLPFLLVLLLLSNLAKGQVGQIPTGFNPIFNGKDLTGWHISRTTHQGTTPNFLVADGTIVGKEKPYGQGGLLLTDETYKSFEFYAKSSWIPSAIAGSFYAPMKGGCLPD